METKLGKYIVYISETIASHFSLPIEFISILFDSPPIDSKPIQFNSIQSFNHITQKYNTSGRSDAFVACIHHALEIWIFQFIFFYILEIVCNFLELNN